MKRQTQKEAARDSVLNWLRSEANEAVRLVREYDDGYGRTYRLERRRLLAVALRAVGRAR